MDAGLPGIGAQGRIEHSGGGGGLGSRCRKEKLQVAKMEEELKVREELLGASLVREGLTCGVCRHCFDASMTFVTHSCHGQGLTLLQVICLSAETCDLCTCLSEALADSRFVLFGSVSLRGITS